MTLGIKRNKFQYYLLEAHIERNGSIPVKILSNSSFKNSKPISWFKCHIIVKFEKLRVVLGTNKIFPICDIREGLSANCDMAV